MIMKSLAATSVALWLIAPLAANAEKPVPVTVVNPVVPVEVSNVDPIPTAVANTAANPVPVRPGGEPVQAALGTSPCLSTLACGVNVYTVPTGKLLIIEFVGVRTDTPDPTDLFRVTLLTELDGTSVFHELGMLSKHPGTALNAQHQGGFPVRLYAGPETSVLVTVSLGASAAGIDFLNASISGRLVDY